MSFSFEGRYCPNCTCYTFKEVGIIRRRFECQLCRRKWKLEELPVGKFKPQH